MRSTVLILTLTALTTLACKREDTSSPADTTTTTTDASDSDVTPSEEPEPSAEPSADALEACNHLGQLMQSELSETVEITDEETASRARECAVGLDDKRTTLSDDEWQTWHGCVMAAQTVEAVVACG